MRLNHTPPWLFLMLIMIIAGQVARLKTRDKCRCDNYLEQFYKSLFLASPPLPGYLRISVWQTLNAAWEWTILQWFELEAMLKPTFHSQNAGPRAVTCALPNFGSPFVGPQPR